VAVIERSGARERASAGAVAIHEIDETLWVVVGDWSNRHMDFYRADMASVDGKIQFHKTGEIDMTSHLKQGWKDPAIRSFQNINLWRLKDQFYLVGLAADDESNGDIVEVF